ncbi:MAG: hypothetical protein HOZ81_20155 [Streptomyces sp.]|nr:hypothetical protein [Streptomyces sp.]NUS81855.1 hypothetical protein [Streptomyces sp.]
MNVSLCKHSFPCQPPHGSIIRPGDCTGCGTTYDAVQAELQRQEQALIVGSSREGRCRHCGQTRRLYRFQPCDKPWSPPGYEEPVSFLCTDGWNEANDADRIRFYSLIDEAAS